jgi:beta-phosphoglucomutase-like phosphatase (HAD superfamily)
LRGSIANGHGEVGVRGNRHRAESTADDAFVVIGAAEGIVQALDAISAPSCVASSGAREKARHSLRLVGLGRSFQ